MKTVPVLYNVDGKCDYLYHIRLNIDNISLVAFKSSSQNIYVTFKSEGLFFILNDEEKDRERMLFDSVQTAKNYLLQNFDICC